MNTIKWAWLHITRKKGKSLLLLLIMILISTLLFSSVLIYSGTRSSLEDLKLRFHSSFALESDVHNEEFWASNEAGTNQYFTGPQLTPALIQNILQTENMTYNTELELMWPHAQDFQLVPGRFQKWYEEEDFSSGYFTRENVLLSTKTPYLSGNRDSSLYRHFISGALELVEGRHITPQDDKDVAVISRELVPEMPSSAKIPASTQSG
jgi:putative ABC transport system permease protein